MRHLLEEFLEITNGNEILLQMGYYGAIQSLLPNKADIAASPITTALSIAIYVFVTKRFTVSLL
ncbi:hypothetical protein ABD86_16140 [Paenibacillus alvei]|nr:hypothetical protein PAV_12c00350 [Paenibacillus alvei DSM 29]MBG9732831.1 hypothetical protein [Paenibacillus alvei]MBG9745398.1 hypothetical protein [Paenibacillus alvei]